MEIQKLVQHETTKNSDTHSALIKENPEEKLIKEKDKDKVIDESLEYKLMKQRTMSQNKKVRARTNGNISKHHQQNFNKKCS